MKDLIPVHARLDAVTQMNWDTLASKKIFFGHQSVGLNIIQGIEAEMKRNTSIHLAIRETADSANFSAPVFAHAPIGRNMDPRSKIDDFTKILESGVGDLVDIAIFKFCFVDIDRRTDIGALYNYYVRAVEALEGKYPNLRIVTFTVPLTTMPKGIKPFIKRLLRMMPPHNEDNRARQRFNDMFRVRFQGSIFDLARVESTRPNGHLVSFQDGTQTVEVLYPAYTDDGGHLNALGRQVIASELLLYLLQQGK